MSRSSRPPSRPDASPSPPRSEPAACPRPQPRRRRWAVRLASWLRWAHIYVSMFGLATALFFGATGITLNHPGWLGGEAERVVEAEGMLRPEWLSGEVARLEVVEHLRAAHGVRGALAEFRVDDAEIAVTFRGPGYSADAFVDRASGRYRLTQLLHGIVAVMNDLHKGRDTGAAWSLVIDVSAGLLVVISLTGLGLLFYLKLRRRPGLAVMLVGGAVLVAVYLWRVP